MTSRTGTSFDIIFVSGEYWDDHPLSPVGVLSRVLGTHDFSVGIIEKPEQDEDFLRLGAPRLFFGVTSGSVDSMVNNYTPLKKKRTDDPHARHSKMPDRALISYTNALRRHFKGCTIVLGGIEASLRRFAHYDYWDNDLRRSIMYDSRADVLVYGNGEKQIIELAGRADDGVPLDGVPGTCTINKVVPEGFSFLPSFAEVKASKEKFCEMQAGFSNYKNLAQGYDNNHLLQHRYPEYTTGDLDWLYSLGFTRKMHPRSQLKMAQFSVVTHRGCIGECHFCSLSLHQGNRIISRSEESVIKEIEAMTRHPEFKGVVDDLGGPSANMYGMDCAKVCSDACSSCANLDLSHSKLIGLMRKARALKGVKKVYVRSGVRYDLALNSEEYIRELSQHHISGYLKIAPEHVSAKVLKLMNKDDDRLDEFVRLFSINNKDTGQDLRYYFMVGHPGDDEREVAALVEKVKYLKNVETFQVFTPTPMTVSTCMYWTGLNPYTMEEVPVVHDYRTKKKLKTKLMKAIEVIHQGQATAGDDTF